MRQELREAHSDLYAALSDSVFNTIRGGVLTGENWILATPSNWKSTKLLAHIALVCSRLKPHSTH
jgi:virulence-associated protein VapD